MLVTQAGVINAADSAATCKPYPFQRDQQLQEALAHKEEEVSDVRSKQDALQSKIRRALALAHSPIMDPDSCLLS